MDKLAQKIIYSILKNSLLIIIITAIFTLGAFFLIPKIKLDGSVDVFFDKKSKGYIEFDKWKEQFGSDQLVIVAFSDRDIFTENNLKLISNLTGQFESLDYVDKATSLTNVNNIIGQENDFIVEPLVDEIPSTREELARLKKEATSNPLYVENVISEDGKTTAILIELEKQQEAGDIYKKEVVENIHKILKETFPADKKFYVSGHTAIEYFYARYMQEDLKTFMPLIFLILLVILVLSFRSVAGVVLPLLVTSISLIWTMAFLYLCRFSINNVTTIIPPVILSVTLLDSIHFNWELILRRKREEGALINQDTILSDTMRELFVPCFLTSATTAAGLFSLTVSRIPPIRQLGLVAGTGVLFAFVITFTFMPALIKKFNLLKYLRKRESGKERMDRFLSSLARFNNRFKGFILIGSLCLAALSVWAAFRIQTETSILEHFKKGSPIYKSTIFIEDNLSGIHLLNISLETDRTDYFKNPESLRDIEEIGSFLHSIPEVDKTTSIVDYLKEINKSFHNENPQFYIVPSSKDLVSQYVLLYGATDLDDFINSQWSWTTIRVRLKEHSTVRLKEIMDKISSYLNKNTASWVKTEIVGQTVLEVDSNEAVTTGQIKSLSLAMLLIFGMMFINFGSLSVGALSIIPNLFPLLFNFGLMGLIGIRLDSATSMISVIGLGMIVDDTIHLFHSFGEVVKKSGDYEASAHRSLSLKGRPVLITSLILIFGFGVVSFSKFVPTYYFGVLSALLIFNALWMDLLLTPSLLLWFKPKFRD